MKKISSGVYECEHGITFGKSEVGLVSGYKSGLGVILNSDVLLHLKECDDSGVSEKIGKYSREINFVGPEISTYDKNM
ncbi:hypothetical protein HYZ41_00725 [archaeon]|nr:hypothetical protein [archaeon]